MPFKSKAQQRLFFAKESRGELPRGTARRWAHETKNIRGLPERKKRREATRVRTPGSRHHRSYRVAPHRRKTRG